VSQLNGRHGAEALDEIRNAAVLRELVVAVDARAVVSWW
jgi:hypothetical protein